MVGIKSDEHAGHGEVSDQQAMTIRFPASRDRSWLAGCSTREMVNRSEWFGEILRVSAVSLDVSASDVTPAPCSERITIPLDQGGQ